MNSKVCPECENDNPGSEEICQQCGYPLDEILAAVEDENDGTACPNCGKTVSESMKFCDGCGHRLEEFTPVAADEPEPEPEPAPPISASPPVADSSPDEFKLGVVEGFRLRKEYLLYKPEMMLGRQDREADVFPDIDLEDQDDGFVSRRHAVIRVENGIVTVEDLGGENGTTLDNRPIPPLKATNVLPGQVIRLGKVGLILKIHTQSV